MIAKMHEIEKFQVRGIPGNVHKVRFGDRIVDYWAPRNPGQHILIAHDGQGVLDRRNNGINPRYRATWELGTGNQNCRKTWINSPNSHLYLSHTI